MSSDINSTPELETGPVYVVGVEFYATIPFLREDGGFFATSAVANFIHYLLKQRGLAVSPVPGSSGRIGYDGMILIEVRKLKESLDTFEEVLALLAIANAGWGYWDTREECWRVVKSVTGMPFGRRLGHERFLELVDQAAAYREQLMKGET